MQRQHSKSDIDMSPRLDLEAGSLGLFRRGYRGYLARHFIFRFLKEAVLSIYWRIRGLKGELRSFYRGHLSKYAVFRILRNWVLATHFRLRGAWIRLSLRYRGSSFRLAQLDTYVQDHGLHTQVVEAEQRIEIPAPRFIGYTPDEYADLKTVSVISPKLAVSDIPQASVIGGTDFVISGDCALHSSFYRPAREVCPAETFGEAGIDPAHELMRTRVPRSRRRVGAAATIIGQCAGNYAHWLTEILPKLMVLDSSEADKSLPLLIDGWVHPNLHEALSVVNQNRRPLIKVERWEMVSAEHLVHVSPASYIPAEYREYVTSGNILKTGPEEFPFSRTALCAMRDVALKSATPTGKIGRKLYLRRANNGNTRAAVNDDQAEAMARRYGFETIEPGSLSFREQLSIFSEAELVAGQIGAALSNVIFARQSCKIIVMSPYYEDANYYFFSNLFGILGHELHYVVGPQIGDGHPFHKKFKIDLDGLEKAFRQFA
ncbi:glycosyltransferase family 61 protein [Bradyrhizobium sp. U87765 SZCCT0131]|uniref:glycosyltransferase family 61 protein n=1 Tax=unclassified Bradyrhizobium TaxID=2631580 RepID=UPI001BA94C7C|nr:MULTISPECIES: glycosyltransferase 61 family protein [unclassified Bradyrhizobium]MBR1219665.1 glycosyltransferase family 61 protein [Bradyrhizobium sp. U87765 SZCCT0131]MBR1262316.1 glycosyltransferase family 61 protein [Bradyrhizobium sp. U87765 SZCCT0134]MBR1308501.1 glycosyltransferase family 61 protein [Bradyrhizobium sp. U87765 SZCCT0110]MBR1318098.1 glycosyltransferase family 61 protein [Bradyrhizobium sp. U87765 SZCCT0109]MBR1351801.1 glycosyltransferase family 61 protein [Bradyrhizo